jgi:RND family efflux transporter MFP subunit
LIAESKAEVTAARQRVEALQLDLEATRQLYDSTKSVSLEELLKKELEYNLAEAELEGLLIAEKREEIEYRIAQFQIEKRLIRAPFDGIIVKIHLEVGENCTPQDPLVRIADTTKCRLIVHLDASVSRQLKEQMNVRVRIDGSSNPKILPGTVEFISPVVDPSSGLREVKVLFDNQDGQVNPGMTGTLLLK